MNKKLSQIFAIAIIISMTLGIYSPSTSYADTELETIEKIVEETAEYMLKNKEGFLDAWPVIGLARYERTDITALTKDYLKELKKELNEKKGMLTTNKYTDYSKAILALTALGIDSQNIEGYNLVQNLSDMDKLTIQGINGPAWALIALDSNDFTSPISKEILINYILQKEKVGGGWSLSSDTADADITGMVLTSLAKYKDRTDIKPYIERGLSFLSNSQTSDGGFETLSAENAESSAQVILALTSLGVDPLKDQRFIKNGNNVIDNLIKNYYNKTGGFSHIKNSKTDKIATEQAFYGLVSYLRFKEDKTPLFNMTDINIKAEDNEETNTQIKNNPFKDIDNDPERQAIISLNKDGIIEGVTKTEFQPNKNIRRGEFAALITRALKLQESNDHGFIDVKKGEWFSDYVGAAKSSGLIKGYLDNTFKPNNNISRQEAAIIIYNTAKLKGIDTAITESEIRNYLSQFPDYKDISDWSKKEMAFAVKKGYIPNSILNMKPTSDATRSQVAGMLFRLLY